MINKRAQFFLIAAFVIVGIIIGLSVVYTGVKVQKEEHWVYDLSNEINQETAQVINQGVISGVDETKLKERITNLSDSYSESYPDSEIIIIYGKSGGKTPIVNIYYKLEETGGAGIGSANINTYDRQKENIGSCPTSGGDNCLSISGGKGKLKIGGVEYSGFDTSKDNYFYIVVKSQAGTVATTE